MYLGVLARGEEGQSLVIVLLVILAVMAMLIVGLRVAELASMRAGIQTAADIAALAGANIQAQGRMLISVFKAMVFARNLIIVILRVIGFALVALAGTLAVLAFVPGLQVLAGFASWCAHASAWVLKLSVKFEIKSLKFVRFMNNKAIPAATIFYPLYTIGNAMFYAVKNGAIGIAIPMKWGWFGQNMDIIRQQAPSDFPSQEETDELDKLREEAAEACQCVDDYKRMENNLGGIANGLDGYISTIQSELDKRSQEPPETPDVNVCQREAREAYQHAEGVIHGGGSEGNDWVVAIKVRTEKQRQARTTAEMNPPSFSDPVSPPFYVPIGCLGEGVQRVRGTLDNLQSALTGGGGCSSCKQAVRDLQTQLRQHANYFNSHLQNKKDECELKQQQSESESKRIEEKNRMAINEWQEDQQKAKENLKLNGFDGVAVIVVRSEGGAFSGNLISKLSDGREVGVVYAVAYGRCMSMEPIHKDATILKSWDTERKKQLANEFGIILSVLTSFPVNLATKYFELVQWFHDVDESPTGFFPEINPRPESDSAPWWVVLLFGDLLNWAKEVYQQITKQITDTILTFLNLKGAPDMHEWRPALVRFDVGLTQDSETVAGAVAKTYSVIGRIEEEWNSVARDINEVDRTLREFTDLGGKPTSNKDDVPLLPMLDLQGAAAGLF